MKVEDIGLLILLVKVKVGLTLIIGKDFKNEKLRGIKLGIL